MDKMFFVFVYDCYYPTGGMNDYLGSYLILEDAKKIASGSGREIAHIAQVTCDGLEVIARWDDVSGWSE